jgi:sugar transferase (PEP-CTERM system associated)
MPRYGLRTIGLLALDGALVFLCGLAAFVIRFGDLPGALADRRGWLKLLVATAVVTTALFLVHPGSPRSVVSSRRLVSAVVLALAAASLVLACVYYVAPSLEIGRGALGIHFGLAFVALGSWRLVAWWLAFHPRLRERVLLLGDREETADFAREIAGQWGCEDEIVGCADVHGVRSESAAASGVGQRSGARSSRPWLHHVLDTRYPLLLGAAEDLECIARDRRITRVVVVADGRRAPLPFDTLLKLKIAHHVAVEDFLSYYERRTGRVYVHGLQLSWLVFAADPPWKRTYQRMRRAIDILLAFAGLVLSLPVMAVTAVAIKLDSRGPVFYTQERVGLHGRVFKIVKFRSMRLGAEQNGPVWATQSDARVTRVGRVIRKLRVDELPQFVNVLRGDMSFIGPRPERPVFVEALEREIEHYGQRHRVKPGVTGWSQVRYPYGASSEDAREKLQYDLYYIKNQSPALDAIILLETIKTVLFGRGAH